MQQNVTPKFRMSGCAEGQSPLPGVRGFPHTPYFLPSPGEWNQDRIFSAVQLMEDQGTKSERRDDKRRKRRKMKVVGRSVRLLQQIIGRKSNDARKKDQK